MRMLGAIGRQKVENGRSNQGICLGCTLLDESPLSVIAFAGKFTGQQCEPLFCNTIRARLPSTSGMMSRV